jgi:hypothetical protein
MNIEITSFRPLEKNTLRGFLTIRLSDVGLVVKDVCLHEKNGKRWLQLPSKPYKKTDGGQAWAYILEFEKSHYWVFQDAGLSALDAYLSQTGEGLK